MRSIRPRRYLALSLALLTLPGLACRATPEGPAPGKPEPYVPLPDEGPQTIGYFLTLFDRSLYQWSELKIASSTARDANALLALEANMQERSRKRRDELIEVLESGATANRRVAAAALGFTHDPSVLGPLLAVLSDPDQEIVQKALLAIGVLAEPETPLAGIRLQLGGPDDWTRNNAAFALLCLARAGNHSGELAEICRGALTDSEPGVRAQCASALGALADPLAIEALAQLLHDEANLVALASAASLASIGRAHVEQKGLVGRVLAQSIDRVPAPRQPHVLGALRWLADFDLGKDSGPWLSWAMKLP